MRAFSIGTVMVMACGWLGCSDDTGGGGAGATAASGTAASPEGPQGTGTGSGTQGSGTTSTGSTGTGGSPPTIDCPVFPPASGATIDVTPNDAANLPQIFADAPSGSTLVLADGTYDVPATLQLHTEGVTVRSASNDADTVILDGAYGVDEIIAISASNVTLAHITVERAVHHPVHVYPPGPGMDVTGTHLYAVHLIDGGQQFLKVNPVVGQEGYLDDGIVECSLFKMTDAGRPHVETCCGGCYTGGIDAHAAWGWEVRNNRFEGIYCDGAGLAEHAVHFWKGARDTIVENNVIVDCARGIGFGLEGGAGDRVYPDNPYGGEMLAHYDGIIRNNVVYANIPYYDTGIELDETKSPSVFHNTVVNGPNATGFFSSIDSRFASTITTVENNLVEKITVRNDAVSMASNNLEQTPASDLVSPDQGDFHLTAGATDAIDQGKVCAAPGLDIDGQTHDAGGAPDIGADEFGP